MNKKVLVLATLVIAMATTVKAQLNVGSTTAPSVNAALQVSSTNQGVRLPNVALTTTTTFGLAAAKTAADSGMTVYNTNQAITSSSTTFPATGKGVYYWDGTGWISMNASSALSTAAGALDLRVVTGGAFNNHISVDAGVGSNGTSVGTGSANVAIGTSAMSQNTNGANNVAVGINSLGQNTQGFNNVGIGPATLGQNKTSTDNVAIGANALYNNQGINSNGNIAIGTNALYSNSGNFGLHIGIGLNALFANTTGYANVGIGYNALNANTIGNFNTVLGTSSMELNQSGSQNTSIGYQALYNSKGSYNVALGVGAGTGQTAGDNNILIGKNVNAVVTTGSNQMNIGNMIYGAFIDGTGTGGNIQIGHNATPLNGYNTLEVKGTTSIAGAVVMGYYGCPQNSATAYQIVSADCQTSIFYLDNIHYMSSLTLPTAAMAAAASTPQPGQMLRIVNLATSSVVVNGANTDNTSTSYTLVAAGTTGQHSVEYIWIGGVWMHMQ